MTMHVTRYTPGDRDEWDAFVRASRNGTFLFERGYMEYHAGRFDDWSLVLRDRGRVVALLPANRAGTTIASHGGLTYGGLIVGDGMTAGDACTALDAILGILAEGQVEQLVYKCVPHIYHRAPAEEDRYALFLRGAELMRRDVLSVIDYRDRPAPQERRMRSAKKARQAGLVVTEGADFAPFWPVLARNLEERYGVAPVHSLDEISRLAARFPAHIRLFIATREGETLAGAVVFVTPFVCHVQYNAASGEGKRLGALDLVLETLVERFRGGVRYFDFGISTEQDGRFLNRGLIEYKEGFGARAVVHDFYRLRIGGAA
jgi:hypothetical protein